MSARSKGNSAAHGKRFAAPLPGTSRGVRRGVATSLRHFGAGHVAPKPGRRARRGRSSPHPCGKTTTYCRTTGCEEHFDSRSGFSGRSVAVNFTSWTRLLIGLTIPSPGTSERFLIDARSWRSGSFVATIVVLAERRAGGAARRRRRAIVMSKQSAFGLPPSESKNRFAARRATQSCREDDDDFKIFLLRVKNCTCKNRRNR